MAYKVTYLKARNENGKTVYNKTDKMFKYLDDAQSFISNVNGVFIDINKISQEQAYVEKYRRVLN